MAIAIEYGKITIKEHQDQIGRSFRAGVWIPYVLTINQKAQKSTICNSFLIRQEMEPYLNQIVEKWILYENRKRSDQWLSKGQKAVPIQKSGLHFSAFDGIVLKSFISESYRWVRLDLQSGTK